MIEAVAGVYGWFRGGGRHVPVAAATDQKKQGSGMIPELALFGARHRVLHVCF